MGVLCRFWYPALHRVTNGLANPTMSTVAKVVLDQTGLVFASLLSSEAILKDSLMDQLGGRHRGIEDSDDVYQVLLEDIKHEVQAEEPDLLRLRQYKDALMMVMDAKESSPGFLTGLLSPAMSMIIFTQVPRPLQGVAGLVHFAVANLAVTATHRRELTDIRMAYTALNRVIVDVLIDEIEERGDEPDQEFGTTFDELRRQAERIREDNQDLRNQLEALKGLRRQLERDRAIRKRRKDRDARDVFGDDDDGDDFGGGGGSDSGRRRRGGGGGGGGGGGHDRYFDDDVDNEGEDDSLLVPVPLPDPRRRDSRA